MQKSKYPCLPTGRKYRNYIILYFLFWIFNLTGCATTHVPYAPEAGISSIYHRMERGETLWRISKIYNCSLEELVRINRVADVRKIETGQLIFIPGIKGNLKRVKKITIDKFEDFIWPVRGKVISYFGQNFNNAVNKGINIIASSGSPIVASRSGRVSFYTQDLAGLGKTIIIDHQDGFLTVYAGVSSVSVKVGERVSQGKKIAKQNNYLHFEIRKGHLPQNPCYYLP